LSKSGLSRRTFRVSRDGNDDPRLVEKIRKSQHGFFVYGKRRSSEDAVHYSDEEIFAIEQDCVRRMIPSSHRNTDARQKISERHLRCASNPKTFKFSLKGWKFKADCGRSPTHRVRHSRTLQARSCGRQVAEPSCHVASSFFAQVCRDPAMEGADCRLSFDIKGGNSHRFLKPLGMIAHVKCEARSRRNVAEHEVPMASASSLARAGLFKV
jgi:hypothetical protein